MLTISLWEALLNFQRLILAPVRVCPLRCPHRLARRVCTNSCRLKGKRQRQAINPRKVTPPPSEAGLETTEFRIAYACGFTRGHEVDAEWCSVVDNGGWRMIEDDGG